MYKYKYGVYMLLHVLLLIYLSFFIHVDSLLIQVFCCLNLCYFMCHLCRVAPASVGRCDQSQERKRRKTEVLMVRTCLGDSVIFWLIFFFSNCPNAKWMLIGVNGYMSEF